MPKKFIRRKEDFTCEKCGAFIKGAGYTNHCPKCLWSKHVDVHPGDRAEACGGMMKPIAAELKRNEYIIVHRCGRCGLVRRNTAAPSDDFEAILRLLKKHKPKK